MIAAAVSYVVFAVCVIPLAALVGVAINRLLKYRLIELLYALFVIPLLVIALVSIPSALIFEFLLGVQALQGDAGRQEAVAAGLVLLGMVICTLDVLLVSGGLPAKPAGRQKTFTEEAVDFAAGAIDTAADSAEAADGGGDDGGGH